MAEESNIYFVGTGLPDNRSPWRDNFSKPAPTFKKMLSANCYILGRG